mmetsp:Transcript_128850/g.334050  ORF Transcript_128850/g.334050 Transcript_128850/m.334050 type:complete len:228 (-) Transcript_128850:65-748(-)
MERRPLQDQGLPLMIALQCMDEAVSPKCPFHDSFRQPRFSELPSQGRVHHVIIPVDIKRRQIQLVGSSTRNLVEDVHSVLVHRRLGGVQGRLEALAQYLCWKRHLAVKLQHKCKVPTPAFRLRLRQAIRQDVRAEAGRSGHVEEHPRSGGSAGCKRNVLLVGAPNPREWCCVLVEDQEHTDGQLHGFEETCLLWVFYKLRIQAMLPIRVGTNPVRPLVHGSRQPTQM